MAEHSAVVFNTLVLHKRRCSNSETEGLPVQKEIGNLARGIYRLKYDLLCLEKFLFIQETEKERQRRH